MTAADPYIVQQASCRASLLVATAGFRSDDWEDLRQEMVLDCLRRSPKFDPSRGEWAGFVRGVMRNQATVLIARRSRSLRHEVLADDLREPESASPGDVLDIAHRCDPTIALHVSLDVERALRQLPGHLQNLASLLADTPIAEICIATGRSRSWVYSMIRRLRIAFAQAGLHQSFRTG